MLPTRSLIVEIYAMLPRSSAQAGRQCTKMAINIPALDGIEVTLDKI